MNLSRLFVLLTSASGLFGATGVDTFHWSGRVPAGQRLEVRGVNGSIHAEPALGDQVEVFAFKNGREFDLAEIDVQVVQHDGGVTICAVYPSSEGLADECAPGKSGAAASRYNDVSVDFTVRVPKAVRFVARTVNGNSCFGKSARSRSRLARTDSRLMTSPSSRRRSTPA